MTSGTAAERIKAARKAKGWTQEQLAVYADVTSKTVWTAEKGEDVSDKTLRRLGSALGIDFFEKAAS
jgi:transcriptional regulator with XRE-family HTH domain